MDTRTRGLDTGYFKVPKGYTPQTSHFFDNLPPEFEFVPICGGSGVWIEPNIDWYINECERTGRKWFLWYFGYKHLSQKSQVDAWMKQPESPYFPDCYDYEKSRSYKTIPTADQLKEGVERIEDKRGQDSIIYSRAGLVVDFLQTLTAAWLNARWWYLAQYLSSAGEHPGPVPDLSVRRGVKMVPTRILREKVIIHQTADRKPPPLGFYTPLVKAADYDRWCATMSLEKFTHTETPPSLPLTDKQKLDILWKDHYGQ